jgi:serine/threonine protein kinase
MKTEQNNNACPQCGAPLPAGAPGGLCPKCLMQMNLADPTILDDENGSGHRKAKAPSVEEIAPLFPQLEILELLGQGGMGAVYKARQKELDRVVALKILPKEIGKTPGFAERFTREARALAKLNHPNIVTLYEFGKCTSGVPPATEDKAPLYYFLMEYVDGLNLRGLMNRERVAPREALAIVPQICDALQYAHDHGIVHRDIKPENILLDRLGNVKVADFGLAKIVEKVGQASSLSDETGKMPVLHSELTEAGNAILGTPKYMSPEQVEAPGEVDHRADIYALGVVFYQMLTGEMPDSDLAPPSKKVHIDVRLDEVVLRALEQKPEMRYQQASVLKTEVETIVAEAARSEDRDQRTGSSEALAKEEEQESGQLATNAKPYSPWESTVIFAGTIFFVMLLLLGQEVSRPFVLPLTILSMVGLVICVVSWMGYWPFKSPLFPDPSFSSRNLRRNKPMSMESRSRFSRIAIWGAVWTLSGVLSIILIGLNAYYYAHVMSNPPTWLLVLLWSITAVYMTAPFGTTVLGWIAVSKIRRSAGKLYGLWLAVLDGLLFPLLALDVVIIGIPFWAWRTLYNPLNGFAGAKMLFLLTMLLFVIVAVWLTVWIIRRVWRWAKKTFEERVQSVQTASTADQNEVTATPADPAQFRKVQRIILLRAIIMCMVAVIFGSSLFPLILKFSVIGWGFVGLQLVLWAALSRKYTQTKELSQLNAAHRIGLIHMIGVLASGLHLAFNNEGLTRENNMLLAGMMISGILVGLMKLIKGLDAGKRTRKTGMVITVAVAVALTAALVWVQRPECIDQGPAADSPDGLYTAQAQTWAANRIFGDDRTFYRFILRKKDGPVLEQQDVGYSAMRIKNYPQLMAQIDTRFSECGQIVWADDSGQVSFTSGKTALLTYTVADGSYILGTGMDFNFSDPPDGYEKGVQMADRNRGISVDGLQFQAGPLRWEKEGWLRLPKNQQGPGRELFLNLGESGGYEIVEIRLFNHATRGLFHSSKWRPPQVKNPEFIAERIGSTNWLRMKETAGAFPYKIDVWLRIATERPGHTFVLPAKRTASAKHAGSELVITELLAGSMSGRQGPTGEMQWDQANAAYEDRELTLNIENRGQLLEGRYHLVAVEKDGSRHPMDSTHFWDFRKMNAHAYFQIDAALEDVAHFELIPFKNRHKFFFNGLEVPRDESTAASEHAFGPITERTIQRRQEGTTDWFLDLETGNFVHPPAALADALLASSFERLGPSRKQQFAEWVKSSGADMGVYGQPEALEMFGGIWVEAHGPTAETWDELDSLSVEKLKAAIESHEKNQPDEERRKNYGLGPRYVTARDISVNKYFKTRDGTLGILQIVGDSDHPYGVKIRYRLVQKADAQTTSRALEDLKRSEWTQALILFNEIEEFGLNFEKAFTAKNLPEARATVLRLERQMAQFNTRVQGTDCEFSPEMFTALDTLEQALDRGDWDEIAEAAAHNAEFAREFRRIGQRMVELAQASGITNAADFREVLEQDSTAASVEMTFGSVMEKVIYDLEAGHGNEGIELASGRLFSLPKGFNGAEIKEWIASNRIDLLADYARNQWAFMAQGGLKIAELPEHRWEDVTVENLEHVDWTPRHSLELLEKNGQRFYLLHPKATPPLLFAFRTGSGTKGIMQVTGFSRNPRGLKIRYRLAESSRVQSGQENSGVTKAASGEYKISWDNGTSFEILAITGNPRDKNPQWWRPDGTRYEQPPYEVLTLLEPVPAEGPSVVFDKDDEFLVVYGVNTPDGDHTSRLRLEWEPNPLLFHAGEFPSVTDVKTGKRTPHAAQFALRNSMRDLDHIDLTVSMVLDRAEWEPLAVYDGRETHELVNGIMVVFSPPHYDDRAKRYVIDAMHNIPRDTHTLRLVAKLKDGRREVVNFHPGPQRGTPTKGYAHIHDHDFDIHHVVEYTLERTPWLRGELRNISLQSDADTNVLLQNANLESGPGNLQSADTGHANHDQAFLNVIGRSASLSGE